MCSRNTAVEKHTRHAHAVKTHMAHPRRQSTKRHRGQAIGRFMSVSRCTGTKVNLQSGSLRLSKLSPGLVNECSLFAGRGWVWQSMWPPSSVAVVGSLWTILDRLIIMDGDLSVNRSPLDAVITTDVWKRLREQSETHKGEFRGKHE